MDRFARAATMIAEAVEEGVCPSAALAVGVKDRLCLCVAHGYANVIGNPVPVDLDTQYDLASLTKIFATTMVTLRMIEEGRLRLEDTLDRFFDTNPVKSTITIQQLLTHTSGLPASIPLYEHTRSPYAAEKLILSTPLVCAPGEQVVYSCMGFILLGKILEQVGLMPLDLLAQKYVFHPLNMFSTSYLPKGVNIACTEVVDGRPIKGVVHDENARFLGGVSGNAGVFSNIGDCVRMASMLAQEGNGFLSKAMFRLAIADHTPGLAEHRGLGFQLAATRGSFCGDLFPGCAFGHTGFTGTSLLVDPQSGLYVVLLTNRVHPSRNNIRLFRFRSLLHNAVMAEFSR